MGRGIVVDDRQETNCPGVYAAGDVAEARDIVYEDNRVNALWPVAVEQGRVAALNMAGIPAIYPGSLARNILRVFGLSILTAGAAATRDPMYGGAKPGRSTTRSSSTGAPRRD